MKKAVVCLLGSVLFATGTMAFSQIDKVYQGVRSMPELQAMIERSVVSHMAVTPAWHVRVPAGITTTGWVTLHITIPSQVGMPSLSKTLNQFRNIVAISEVSALNQRGDFQDVDGWTLSQWVTKGGKGFYNDDNALAQDLEAFYSDLQAKEPFALYQSNQGDIVRFYPLPVNGIMYQPQGYAQPIHLNSSNFFVIYDVTTKVGRVAPQNPSFLKMLFKPVEK